VLQRYNLKTGKATLFQIKKGFEKKSNKILPVQKKVVLLHTQNLKESKR
jgi:hypothetical protein